MICKPGILDKRGRRQDVKKSAPLYFSIIDENESWYLEDNIRMFGTPDSASDPRFQESNLMHSKKKTLLVFMFGQIVIDFFATDGGLRTKRSYTITIWS